MRLLILLSMLLFASPLLAQPAKIKFIVGAEVSTEMTSLSDLHVITTKGAYNFNEISSMSFWGALPDSTTIELLRNNGISVFLKGKYLKPHATKSDRAWEAKVKGTATGKDTIRIYKNSFYLGSVKMGQRDILTVLQANPASREDAIKAVSNRNGAHIAGFIGGFLIGWPLGQSISGKQDPPWGLAVGGAAILLGAGIPLENGFKRHMKSAINNYNRKALTTGRAGFSIKFYPSVNGGTLLVRF